MQKGFSWKKACGQEPGQESLLSGHFQDWALSPLYPLGHGISPFAHLLWFPLHWLDSSAYIDLSCASSSPDSISCPFCLISPTCSWAYKPQAAGQSLDGLFSHQIFTASLAVVAGELAFCDAEHRFAFSARVWMKIRFWR